MKNDDIFFELKKFLETNPASIQLAQIALEDFEIKIRVSDSLECVYFFQNKSPFCERKPSPAAALILDFTPEGIHLLCNSHAKNLVDLISDFFKIYLSELVKVDFKNSLSFAQIQALKLLAKIPSKEDLKKTAEMFLKAYFDKK